MYSTKTENNKQNAFEKYWYIFIIILLLIIAIIFFIFCKYLASKSRY